MSAASTQTPTSTGSVPLWLHGKLHDDAEASRRTAAGLGVTRLVGAGSPEEVRAVREAGLEPWLCLGAFSVAEEERHLQCRSLDGSPRRWFSSGCPSHPEVRRRLLDRVREMAGWGAAGILLDGIRFASPYEGADTFFTCTCRWCTAAAADHGVSMAQVTDGLRHLRDRLDSVSGHQLVGMLPTLRSPADLLAGRAGVDAILPWLRYRAAVTIDAVAEVRAVLRAAAPSMQLGAYVFTPSLAPLVGQDYAPLEPHLDVVAPMIYRLGQGPACLASEVAGLAQMLPGAPEAVREAATVRFLGLEPAVRQGRPLEQGMAVAAVSLETRRARARLSGRAQLVPILWLDDDQVAPSTAAALAGTPDGISFFATGDARAARLREARGYLTGLAQGH